mmetsp:Transcript_25257/g.63356  ORF Transcript_25257/g.63356 Transcript_25257/m.63356 type:complete len:416 (-) Transcript_25257:73-1320(-)
MGAKRRREEEGEVGGRWEAKEDYLFLPPSHPTPPSHSGEKRKLAMLMLDGVFLADDGNEVKLDMRAKGKVDKMRADLASVIPVFVHFDEWVVKGKRTKAEARRRCEKAMAAMGAEDFAYLVLSYTLGPCRFPSRSLLDAAVRVVSVNVSEGGVDREGMYLAGPAMLGCVTSNGKVVRRKTDVAEKLAFNAGISYVDSDGYYASRQARHVGDVSGVDPTVFAHPPSTQIEHCAFADSNYNMLAKSLADAVLAPGPTLFVLMGPPASGKSTFYHRHLRPRGFAHCNNDSLGSKAKTMQVCRSALEEGGKAALDNLNATEKTRSDYLSIAKQCSAKVYALHFVAPLPLCHHLNIHRERLTRGERERVPAMVFASFEKGKQMLAKGDKEGGCTIVDVWQVPFMPAFKNQAEKDLFCQRS